MVGPQYKSAFSIHARSEGRRTGPFGVHGENAPGWARLMMKPNKALPALGKNDYPKMSYVFRAASFSRSLKGLFVGFQWKFGGIFQEVACAAE